MILKYGNSIRYRDRLQLLWSWGATRRSGRSQCEPQALVKTANRKSGFTGLDPEGEKKVISAIVELRETNRRKRKQGVERSDLMKIGKKMRSVYFEYVMARSRHAVQTSTPFHERLVHFWSNHFAVSADNPEMYGLVGSLETEAIRPHINEKFSTMLRAVEQHPAMLTYLSNIQSVGPASEAAEYAARKKKKRKIGINENLAREILELHTLGVNGGYTQQDVTTFASVISGWTYGGIYPRRLNVGSRGEFGRTVAVNGSMGTDHGTGNVAFILGGAIQGGKMLSDWPGISSSNLYQGRDLKPTIDMRSLFKTVLHDHLLISNQHLDSTVFPDSSRIKQLKGILS